jgi:hypothetical protein
VFLTPLSMTIDLPLELLHFIVTLVDDAPQVVAYPASHLVTRTFLSLCLVSSALNPIATRLLYLRCAYIDGPGRLRDLCRTLSNAEADITEGQPGVRVLAERQRTISGLVLSPFALEDVFGLETVRDVARLLGFVTTTLERLVVDMPLRCLYPEDDVDGVRPILRHAFERLERVEELCSAQDEFFLATFEFVDEWGPRPAEPEVWSSWPNLRRLALYNPVMGPELASDVVQHAEANYPHTLTHLFLARADFVDWGVPTPVSDSEDGEFLDALDDDLTALDLFPRPTFPLPSVRPGLCFEEFLERRSSASDKEGAVGQLRRIAFIDVLGRQGFGGPVWKQAQARAVREMCAQAARASEGRPTGGALEVIEIVVDLPPDLDAARVVQRWMRDRAADGTLWDMSGRTGTMSKGIARHHGEALV